MKYSSVVLIFFLMISCASDSSTDIEPPDNGEDDITLVKAFPNLSFTRPLNIVHAGDQTNRLFVEEQAGVIYVFENNPETEEKTVFLDIRDRVTDSGNEQGLLGLAFHPDYETNGFFYVNYTAANPTRTIVSRFKVSDENPGQADPDSETELLSFAQPYSNHNGGHLTFGPDGFLYIGVGDGGSGGDPQGNGQNRKTWLGSILRIDVDASQNGKPYGIPADNPFAGNKDGFREEIFAYGLRNPWRFSFDSETGNLWAGDVGQNRIEEIHIIENGLNYGWNILEGSQCYRTNNCDKEDLELPVIEYPHSYGNVSVTGGFVYHGSETENLIGQYIYADYVSGRIWTLDISNVDNPTNALLVKADFNISSFGTDQHNELYICGFDGSIYKLRDNPKK